MREKSPVITISSEDVVEPITVHHNQTPESQLHVADQGDKNVSYNTLNNLNTDELLNEQSLNTDNDIEDQEVDDYQAEYENSQTEAMDMESIRQVAEEENKKPRWTRVRKMLGTISLIRTLKPGKAKETPENSLSNHNKQEPQKLVKDLGMNIINEGYIDKIDSLNSDELESLSKNFAALEEEYANIDDYIKENSVSLRHIAEHTKLNDKDNILKAIQARKEQLENSTDNSDDDSNKDDSNKSDKPRHAKEVLVDDLDISEITQEEKDKLIEDYKELSKSINERLEDDKFYNLTASELLTVITDNTQMMLKYSSPGFKSILESEGITDDVAEKVHSTSDKVLDRLTKINFAASTFESEEHRKPTEQEAVEAANKDNLY